MISHIRLQEAYDNYDQVYKATASKKRSAMLDGRYVLTQYGYSHDDIIVAIAMSNH